MCGITGIINLTNTKVSQEELTIRNNLIIHRGPDDEGYYFGDNFAFGHRRLAVLDLSPDGHQPMHYQNRYVIIYNGEIYNYIEIQKVLLYHGYTFKSKTDTEVILAAYDFWGEACVNYFNGMWAFSIYDTLKNNIFCSRDRFGIKPFYYKKTNKQFLFGSEIKQLLALSDAHANLSMIIDFVVTGMHEHTHETFFENIFKLLPSHNLIYDLTTHEYSIKRYYSLALNDNVRELSQQDAQSLYASELQRAIQYRLRSDVKVGTCLSGGLDSSTIATLASHEYSQQTQNHFSAIHAKSIEALTDESIFASIVAKANPIDLFMLEPSQEDFLNNIEEVIYTQEEPFGSPSIFMQYFVMQKAKQIGCKVMLDGQGGDETLIGYERYYPAIYYATFKHGGLMAGLKTLFYSHKNNQKMTYKNIIYYTIGSFCSSLRETILWRKVPFIRPKFKKTFSFFERLALAYKNLFSLQKLEIEVTNLPMLLRYEDKNSMRHSIETRLPFLDYKTLEIALSISFTCKVVFGWSKYILRKILEMHLPKSIVWRKQKLGFNAPNKTWMDALSSSLYQELERSWILHYLCDYDHLSKTLDSLDNNLKWRLYNIAVWERIYHVIETKS